MNRKPGFVVRLVREARALDPREAWNELLRRFARNDLLTYASAISFRVLFALIPLLLLGLAVLGALGLSEVWRDDVAPRVQEQTSDAAFEVIDQTVEQVLAGKQLLWGTLGAVIAIWEVSAGMRAVMQLLNRVYNADDERTFPRRIGVSLWLAGLVTTLLLAAVACAAVLPRLAGGGVLLRGAGWLAALVLLFATVAALVRFAPSKERPFHWVSFGAVLVVTGWVGASLLYGWYVTSLADYGSLFGSLAVAIVTMGYVYVQSIVFITGLQLDAMVRDTLEHGDEPPLDEHPQVIVARTPAEAQALAEDKLGSGA